MLLLLKLRKAPFPYLLERQRYVPQRIYFGVKFVPLRDLHQT